MGSSVQGGPPKKTVVRSRPDAVDPSYVGWIYIDDHYEKHIASRGNLGFRSTTEVKDAIKALMELLPVIDRLAYLAPSPEMIGVEPQHAEDVLDVVDRGQSKGDEPPRGE